MLRAAAVILCLCLVACDQSSNRVSTLWTNVPEIASAVEQFNASQREWQLLVEYKEDPATLLTGPGVKADLVVARGLASAAVKSTFVPLDFLFDGGSLAKASFYHRGLDAGQQDDRLKLLPISFDLPVLIYSKKLLPELPGFSLTLANLKLLNEQFNASVPKNQRRLAFSPRWDAFSVTFLQWSGTNFHESFQGNLAWNSAALADSLKSLQAWPSPGWDQTSDFQRKYLHADPTPVLTSNRVEFYPSTLAAFLNRPWGERRDLDFRFLDQDGRALAGDTVWAGIPSSSLTRGAGERFLAWLFRSDTQESLVENSRTLEGTFGLAQGLSSLTATNAGALTEVFPELAGRIPGADQVAFWPTLPVDWPLLKTAVLRPWLETQTASETSLRAGLDRERSQAARR